MQSGCRVFLDDEPRPGLVRHASSGFGRFVKMPFLPVLCEFFHPVYVTNTVSESASEVFTQNKHSPQRSRAYPTPFIASA
jgi:hypothetical protein